MKRLSLAAAALLLSAPACYTKSEETPASTSSFRVQIKGLYPASAVADANGNRTPLEVESTCAAEYGNAQDQVPLEKRGTEGCRYVIPHGEVDVDLSITALDNNGQRYQGFNGPLAFRVVPGDLAQNNALRWVQMSGGQAEGTVRVSHVYGEVRVWVEDAPVTVDYEDGGVRLDMENGAPVANQLPDAGSAHSFATGVSSVVLFEEPTLAKVQLPDGFDNRSSPFVGQFLNIGRPPTAGAPILQHCQPTDPNNGKEMMLLVTGTDPSGFFVTDLTACRAAEDTSADAQVRVPEPGGFLPGTYGSMFVYNYNYPEGLDRGDLLWTLSGSVQEFTSTTQMVFPSWTVREHVRQLPPAQWNKYLDQLNVPEISARTCGLSTNTLLRTSNQLTNYVTDATCGQNRRVLKMESLESALVKVKRVRFPDVFHGCDQNGDGQVPFFCETTSSDQPAGYWAGCAFPPPAVDPDASERQCNIDCTIGQGTFAGKVCAERTTFASFGQFIVEMPGPGPAEAGLDPSISARVQSIPVTATSARSASPYVDGTDLRVWCNVPVRVRFGGSTVVADAAAEPLAANTLLENKVTGGAGSVAVIADGPVDANSQCSVSADSHTRINLVIRDAVPDLNPDCDPTDADEARATQCRALRAARFDVVGHLRHVQAARPRWVITPRDADDLCCYPGEGLACPKPIKSCQ